MGIKSKKALIERVFLISIFFYAFNISDGQQSPLNTMSYWVFNPLIYNPAIVGSKDFLSVGLNGAFQGNSNTQLLSGNTRLSKSKAGYLFAPSIKEFNNIGLGWSLFRDVNGSLQNIGASIAGSYQVPVSRRKLSFISVGASFKGVYNKNDSSFSEPPNPAGETFYPNLDLGIYYYGPKFFTGLSSTNFLGNPGKPDSLGRFAIPVSREYFFSFGYKFLLSRSLNIVLEPSVLISANDSVNLNIKDNLKPIIKLYLDNFCVGSYFLTDGTAAFFFQYRFPKVFIGAFYELPRNTPYFKIAPTIEVTIGLNIPIDKARLSTRSHW